MIIAVTLFLFFGLLLFGLGRKYGDSRTILFLQIGWAIKCLAGIAFIYVYSHFYGKGNLDEDAGAYFREAKVLNEIKVKNSSDYFRILFNQKNAKELISKYFDQIPASRFSREIIGINDTRNHIKTISILLLIFDGNSLAVFMVFFFLSYLGFVILWLAIKNKVQLYPLISFVLILLPPSILFWTSSNLKEVPFLFGFCLIIASFFVDPKHTAGKVMRPIGFLFLLLFKPILLYILITSWIVYHLVDRIFVNNIKSYWLLVLFVGLLLWLFAVPSKALKAISDQQFDFINIGRGGIQVKGDTSFYFISGIYRDRIKQIDSTILIRKNTPAVSNLFGKIRNEKQVILKPDNERLHLIHDQKGGGSFFEITPINNNWLNLFKSIPEAIVNTFLRPFIWNQTFQSINIVLFIENLFFLTLLFYVILNRKKIHFSHLPLFSIALTFILILAIVIGLTTPVSGAIARYRIPNQLFIIVLFLMTKFKHERTN